MKEETVFRLTYVLPFLKTLKNTTSFPIQQSTIRGTPDFLLCCNGFFVALELKAVKGHLDKLQAYNLKRVEKSGGIAFVTSPLNWRETKACLAQLDKGEFNG